ncbi:MAG: response regulator [Solirubrobacterales bacterium]
MESAEEHAPAPGDARPVVLLIDDDEFVAKLIARFLGDGADVTWAGTGANAVQRISERDWDAIVVDIELPDISGLELLGIVRRERPLAATMMLSSHSGPEYAARAIGAGADRYQVKPVGPEEIRTRIAELVALTESRRAGAPDPGHELHARKLRGRRREPEDR